MKKLFLTIISFVLCCGLAFADGGTTTVGGDTGITVSGTVNVEDDVFGAGWNGDGVNAPSQNAVYDHEVTQQTDIDSVVAAEMANADFGDWTCAAASCTLDNDVVKDEDIDWADVTCADITTMTDCGAVTSSGWVTAGNGFDCTGAADCDIGSADILDVSIFEGGNTYVFDDGLTIPTGLALTVGATAWASAGAADTINGEMLENDSVDDDSIDFGDVTCTDLTMTDCGAITSTGVVDLGGATSFEFPNSADPTTDAEGECAWNSMDDVLECYDGTSSKVVATTSRYLSVSFDPGIAYDSDTQVFLFTVHEADGIYITKWWVSCNLDPPAVEMDMDLKRADAWIGLANSAVMDVMDTTNGVSSETTAANINGGAAIADTKVVYLDFGGDPEGTCQQLVVEMEYVIADD